jgi:hypothetical protein
LNQTFSFFVEVLNKIKPDKRILYALGCGYNLFPDPSEKVVKFLKDFNKRLLDEKAFLEEYDSISLFEE